MNSSRIYFFNIIINYLVSSIYLNTYFVKRVIRGNINEAWLSLVIDKY